jgi:hypothetical protein
LVGVRIAVVIDAFIVSPYHGGECSSEISDFSAVLN